MVIQGGAPADSLSMRFDGLAVCAESLMQVWLIEGSLEPIAAMAHLLISWFILPALEAAVMPRNNVS